MRFHFQVRTGTHLVVTELADLPSTYEVRVDAAKRIGVLLHDHAGKLWAGEDWRMDETDERGLVLFVINVSAMRTPATLDPRSEYHRTK